MMDPGSPTEPPSLSPTSPWNPTVVGSDDEVASECPTLVVPTECPTVLPTAPLAENDEDDYEDDTAPHGEEAVPAAPPRDEDDSAAEELSAIEALLGEQMANAKRAKFRKVLEDGMTKVDEKKNDEEIKNEKGNKNVEQNEKGEERHDEERHDEERHDEVAPAAASSGSGGAAGSLSAEQHRERSKFVPDARNPAEVRLRKLLDKKNAREVKRREKKMAEAAAANRAWWRCDGEKKAWSRKDLHSTWSSLCM